MLVSTISHRIRKDLGLSLQEYAVCEAIFNAKCFDGKELSEGLGITSAQLTDVVSELVHKKMLNQIIYTPTDNWTKHFDYDAQLEELWDTHPKGVKKVARKRWDKIKGKVDFEKLKQFLIDYRASKPPDKICYLNGLDVLLEPINKRWEQPIILDYDLIKQRTEKPKQPISNFFQPDRIK